MFSYIDIFVFSGSSNCGEEREKEEGKTNINDGLGRNRENPHLSLNWFFSLPMNEIFGAKKMKENRFSSRMEETKAFLTSRPECLGNNNNNDNSKTIFKLHF